MTRVLSELLGVPEPTFRMSLNKLEATAGRPSTDIRFSTQMHQELRAKLRELGLDPDDTTGPELYQALSEKIKSDDKRLKMTLLKLSKGRADEDLVSHIANALNQLDFNRQCFALKATVAKRLLKKLPPKQTLRTLNYRSLDSMIKHEPVVALFAAAHLLEGATWQRGLLEQYKKLTPADFETRSIQILNPNSKKWHDLATKALAQSKHNILSVDELGAVIMLPLTERPDGATLAIAGLSLEAINEIHSSSTFMKLYQVKPDFGEVVKAVALREPCLSTNLLDQPVPWQLIQRYYSRFKEAFRPDVFEPHIQPSDLAWHPVEKILAKIEPSLKFWYDTSYLGQINEDIPVSLNMLDASLNYCNKLPYGSHVVHYLRNSLVSELLLRYLKHENVERAVLGELQAELEPVII